MKKNLYLINNGIINSIILENDFLLWTKTINYQINSLF